MLNDKELELIDKIQKKTVYEDKFFEKRGEVKWFDELEKRGYFNPNPDTRPYEYKEKGVFIIPQWNILPYLEWVSEQINDPGHEKYIDELLTIIIIQRIIVISIIVTLLGCALLFLSHRKARRISDAIMEPILDRWYYYDTTFFPIVFKEEKDNSTWNGPSWWISYDAKETMAVGPISIHVSLLGKVTGTNPLDLRERIIPFVLQSNKIVEPGA